MSDAPKCLWCGGKVLIRCRSPRSMTVTAEYTYAASCLTAGCPGNRFYEFGSAEDAEAALAAARTPEPAPDFPPSAPGPWKPCGDDCIHFAGYGAFPHQRLAIIVYANERDTAIRDFILARVNAGGGLGDASEVMRCAREVLIGWSHERRLTGFEPALDSLRDALEQYDAGGGA